MGKGSPQTGTTRLAAPEDGGNGHPVGAKEALKTYFGFEEFLEGQEHIITEILEGRDGLAVMPTGGGKSLCYQLPALCLPGVTLRRAAHSRTTNAARRWHLARRKSA